MADTPALPTIESLVANPSKASYELLEAISASDGGDDDSAITSAATSLVQQLFVTTEDPTNSKTEFAIAVGLFSLLHHDSVPPAVTTLLQALVGSHQQEEAETASTTTTTTTRPKDIQLAQCLIQHIADGTLLNTILPIPDLQKKLRLMNTSTFYRQQKFNLLAEESEGYSKLLLAYMTPPENLQLLPATNASSSSKDTTMIDTLIGTFSLDPVRCLDIAIDCLTYYLLQQQRKQQETITTTTLLVVDSITHILRTLASSTQKLPQLFAFKLSQQQQQQQQIREALIQSMCWLWQHGVLDLASVLPFCQDDDDDDWTRVVDTAAQAIATDAWKEIRAKGKIRLASPRAEDATTTTTREQHLQPVTSLWIVQCIMAMLKNDTNDDITVKNERWNTTVAPLLNDWSQMAALFPDTIGVAVLDSVAARLQHWSPLPASPWKEATTTTADTTIVPDMTELLDLVSQPLDMVLASGCIRFRPQLYVTLCRLLVQAWPTTSVDDTTTKQDPRLQHFIRTFLLPSLSVFSSHPTMHLEIWAVVEKLDYQDRYRLYDTWQSSSSAEEDGFIWLADAETDVLKSARYTLRRLSKDTVRELSRDIAKCCVQCPAIVFTTILNQIESYNNLIHVMIEACRFVGPLGWDVLGYCILQRLTRAGRDRTKQSGVFASQWLQSLEQFTGAFYKRYPTAEFQGLVTYLRSKLEAGEVLELGMLGALVTTAGGWGFRNYSPTATLTEVQLNGMAGSITLQRQTVAFGIVEAIDWRAAKQVQKVLRKDGVNLLILTAQVQYQIIFKANENKPVKLIGKQVDECQVLRAVLLDYLTNEQIEETSAASYHKALPTMQQLLQDYQVEPGAVWQLCRPVLDKSEASMDEKQACLQSMIPASSWSHITVDLYEMFWSHTIQDIYCPERMYETEISRLDTDVGQLTRELENLKKPGGSLEDKFSQEEKKFAAEGKLGHTRRVVEELKKDKKKQASHVAEVLEKIKSKIGQFFASPESSNAAMMVFFAQCIYPRCMQGPCDAFYCVKFIDLLHRNKTPGFGLLPLYDVLIPILSKSLYRMTEGEAAWASILFNEVWKTANACRYDKAIFEAHFPSSDPDDFKTLFNKWHYYLGATCLGCLESTEYIHLRNCLTLLTRIVDVFPTKPSVGNKLLQALDPLQADGNSMADIRAAAAAYSSQLKHARSQGAWKEEGRAAALEREKELKAKSLEKQKRYEQAAAEGAAAAATSGEEHRSRPISDDRRTDSRRGGAPNERWPRDRGAPEPRRDDRRRDERRDDRRPIETRKRSRPPSPTEQGEAIDDGASKPAQNKRTKEDEGDDHARRPRQRRRTGRR